MTGSQSHRQMYLISSTCFSDTTVRQRGEKMVVERYLARRLRLRGGMKNVGKERKKKVVMIRGSSYCTVHSISRVPESRTGIRMHIRHKLHAGYVKHCPWGLHAYSRVVNCLSDSLHQVEPPASVGFRPCFEDIC